MKSGWLVRAGAVVGARERSLELARGSPALTVRSPIIRERKNPGKSASLGERMREGRSSPEPVGVSVRDPPQLSKLSSLLAPDAERGQAASSWQLAVGQQPHACAARGGVCPGDPGARALMAPLVAGREAH